MKLKYTKPSSPETLRTSTRKTGALLRSQHTAVAGAIGKTVVRGMLDRNARRISCQRLNKTHLHEIVNHAETYVPGRVHTAENF